jgi:hypothetical protein
VVPVMQAAAGRRCLAPWARPRSRFRGSCRMPGRSVSRGSRRFRPDRQGNGVASWSRW